MLSGRQFKSTREKKPEASRVQGSAARFPPVCFRFIELLLHTVGQLQQECELTSSQGRLMKGGADALKAGIKSLSSVQVEPRPAPYLTRRRRYGAAAPGLPSEQTWGVPLW